MNGPMIRNIYRGKIFRKLRNAWFFLSEIILFNVSLSVKGLCKLYKVKDFHVKYSKFTENNLANKEKVLWFRGHKKMQVTLT